MEDGEKNRKKIYIDGEYVFFLYPKELRQYGLKEGEELSEELYEEIWQKVVLIRAKRKMLALLSRKDYTCAEIARKLRQGYYTDDIIEQAICYGVSMGYLDDAAYAKQYIAWKKETKSLRWIAQQLSQKGVAKSVYEPLLEEEEDDEDKVRQQVERYMQKKSGDAYTVKQKTYRHFVQKGYSSSFIREILKQF